MIKGIFGLLLICCFSTSAQYREHSVLSGGTWYKLAITQTGIHKIDHAFLKSLGLDPASIAPDNIHMYGNGGGMLPQSSAKYRQDDLQEIAISIIGTKTASFGTGNTILFYAQGPNTWEFNPTDGLFVHTKNLYSDTSFYFLTVNTTPGLRVPANTCNTNTTLNAVTTFDDRNFHENDLVNLLKSGREWYGEQFDVDNNQDFSFALGETVPNTQIKVTSRVVVKPKVPALTIFTFRANDVALGNINLFGNNACSNCTIGTEGQKTMIANTNDIPNLSTLKLNVSYDKSNDPSASAFLNYITINFKRKLTLQGSQMPFRDVASSNKLAKYMISNVNENTITWNVTNASIPYECTMETGSFCDSTAGIAEYVVFDKSQITLMPLSYGKINNQDLHGIDVPQLLIVTSPSLYNEAERLAIFRRKQGITAYVATTNQIYNEFSSGSQDITAIRDFARMLYKKGGLKNLLLLGSCSYDYKYRTPNNTNLVPVYESRNSLNEVNSYSSEDFYGFLDDTEGEWVESSSGNHSMDIGVGRLPVYTASEAAGVVDKLIHYSSNIKSLGKWRNRICFMADNGDGNSHLGDANSIADFIDSTFQRMNVNKIYLDAYPLVSNPAGFTSPATNEAIRNEINLGNLIMNYSGHGGPEQLSQEKIIDVSDLKNWKNIDRLPFLVTATCDFGVYDNPYELSGGNRLIVQNDGGAIGIITASRPVYQYSNKELNFAFYGIAIPKNDTTPLPTLGDIIKHTKNNSLINVNNRSYALLGDPSMTLNYPKDKISLTKINGKAIGTFTDTIKALAKIELEGEIQFAATGQYNPSFQGVVTSLIYDKKNKINTLGQVSGTPRTTFDLRDNIIQSGQASIRDGKFKFSFIVPKDINYIFGNGKISLYAYNKNTSADAGGYNTNMIIGGSMDNSVSDNVPPDIQLFMDDTTFRNGGMTGSQPTLIAKLYDENGINIAKSGIGHEITGVLNQNAGNPILLNDYYITNIDDYTRGVARFQLSSLPEGNHTIRVKAWDVFNNSSEKELQFIVASNAKIAIQSMINFPNPVSESTTFRVLHNRAGEDLLLHIKIYNQAGDLVQELKEDIQFSNSTLEIKWNVSNGGAYNMTQGMYVYKCQLISKKDDSVAETIQKLVLIH